MDNFIKESLNPSVFWGAFSAVCNAPHLSMAALRKCFVQGFYFKSFGSRKDV